MNKLGLKAITGAKYVYLTVFFILLAGFFYPLISGASFVPVVNGTLVLFVGLAGAVMVYNAVTSDSRQGIYLGGGFGFIAVSLTLIMMIITGRI